MANKVLVIGSGGREHAICWKLAHSDKVGQIFVSPGNIGICQVQKVSSVNLDLKNHELIAQWCKQQGINLVVVGPEDPLAAGIADVLGSAGIHCFGPRKNAAQIEANKSWAKEFMDKNNIPTAKWQAFTDAEAAKKFILSARFEARVVKASGLAAGKGVIVAESKDEACKAVDAILKDHQFGAAGESIVIEELLEGEEVSVLAFTDGQCVKLILPSQDHKRHLDGDKGGNTGGMGAYCPYPLDGKDLVNIEKCILQKTVDGLKKEGAPFTGVLYAGLMLTKDGPKVLEFNCRFGDPETQVILPLLESDLYEIMLSCCEKTLSQMDIHWKINKYAVGVVMASRGYPETSTKGNAISGVEEVNALANYIVYHSGTAVNPEGNLVTNGGRVLIVVCLASDLATAAGKATSACKRISFDGAQYRHDIAHKGIVRALLNFGTLTYKSSGVDIDAGDQLVNAIKLDVGNTNRSGVMGSIGGFGGLFDIKSTGYTDPVLVSGTDGVGTKLLIAHQCKVHSTVGIDLVAMCVNDILAHGAEPLFFLDYFASGKLEVDTASEVVSGVAEGCRIAGCALVGGETAEMPSLYKPGEYDLAGFAVGAVERSRILPRIEEIKESDVVIGLPSSGIHSNGFSLVRKVIQQQGLKFTDKAPFSKSGKTIGEELLTPTKIYVKEVLPVLKSGHVKALAHITGGGLLDNLPRILSKEVGVYLDASCWDILSVFAWLAVTGGISKEEMLRTFNCGIGMVLIVNEADKDLVLSKIRDARVIGRVENKNGDGPQVIVRNFISSLEVLARPFIESVVEFRAYKRKRVGVLISGSGTNLQSLIDATSDISFEAEIVLVISNKDKVQGLVRAQNAGIPTKVIKHTSYKSRLDFDMAVHAELISAGVEIVCLAGFMRVLTGEFVSLWRGRLINIHPALLPLFKGTHAHRQALEAGVRVTGCTAHFVEEDIDAGAILAQEAVPIEIGDTEEILQERVKVAEHRVFPHALKLVASGKAFLDEYGKIVWS